MAAQFIQQKIGSATSGSTVTFPLDAAPLLHSDLVLNFGANPVSCLITGVTGGGVTWERTVRSNFIRTCEIWIGLDSDGSSSTVQVTVTGTLTGSGGLGNVSEWQRLLTFAPNDGTAAGTSGGTTTPTTPNITISSAGSVIFICERGGHASYVSGPTNSFTPLSTPTAQSFQAAYRAPGATGTYGASWTMSGGTIAWETAIAAYKPAAASLFRGSGMAGLGAGGPFFHDPLQAKADMIARRRRYFIMRAAESCFKKAA